MTEYLQGQSECSGQTSSEGHVLEEFIPMKRTSSSDNEEEDDDEQQSPKPKTSEKDKNNGDKKKSDWMRSVQLWNPTPDPPLKEVTKTGKRIKLLKEKFVTFALT